jgi:hypothetical protein
MGKPSQEFDERLFTLKLSKLSREMHAQERVSDRKARAEARKTGGSSLVNGVTGRLAVLREWLEGVDRICREVWQIQGKEITPDFVRDVLLLTALALIETRKGSIMADFARRALMTRVYNPYPAHHHLAMEINRLKSEVSRRYEIEAGKVPAIPRPAGARLLREALE